MDEWNGKERRHYTADTIDTIVRDHEKAINTLISSTQHMTQAIMQFEKQFERIAKTLEKLADIDKHILEANFIKEDFKKRIETLEQSHNGSGCHALKEALLTCNNNKDKLQTEVDELYEKLEKVDKKAGAYQDDKNKILATIILALLMGVLGLLGLHK